MGGGAVALEAAMRLSSAMPVIGHIVNDEFLLELRSVPERDDAAFANAVGVALS
jgi:hypothetical protein